MICSFKAVEHFDISLSSYLLKVLQLANTTESKMAAVPVTLLPPKRQTLYVHSNLVEAHFVNSDQKQIIRVINNNAKDGEQVLLFTPEGTMSSSCNDKLFTTL